VRVHRLIDANANRAREALRAMEDTARFVLDDAGLCARLKDLRHGLREAVGTVDRGLLVAWRDTPGDVGTAVTTPSEGERDGVRGVALAAAARLTEALRVIEEGLKALGADGAPIEALRYRGYDIERDLTLALGSGRGRQWTLCVLLSESLCRLPWERVAELAVEGGADCVQLREKGLGDPELLARARALREITRGRADVIVNDRPDIAVLSAADGVHLGQSDMSVADARRIVGFDLLVGVSTSRIDEARAAVRAGADYLGLGPMFASTTKPKERLAGPEYLREFLADPVTSARPHLAISGITPESVGELARLGCRGIAVSSVVCAAEHPDEVCRQIGEAMSLPHPTPHS